MAIETARILPLTDLLAWDRSRAPDQTLTSVRLAEGVDTASYGARDFELQYRDLVVAAALAEVALQTSDVWGFALQRPALPSIPSDVLEDQETDKPSPLALPGTVNHVVPSSIPLDAVTTDQDLYGRDLILWEALARIAAVMEEPQVLPLEPSLVLGPSWSLGEGARRTQTVNPALPLGVDLFKDPDRNLAQRDNDMAAYVALAWQAIHDIYTRATRLLVQVDDSEMERDPDEYVLFEDTPEQRVWITEPGLVGRNRVVFDKVLRRVTWYSDQYVFQGDAAPGLSLAFGDVNQFIVHARVPGEKDAEFYRQKAEQLRLGPLQEVPIYYQPHANLDYVAGVAAFLGVDNVMLASDESSADFTPQLASWEPGVYRFGFLVETSRQIRLYGSLGTGGWPIVSATGATMTGPGQMGWAIKLVAGTYTMRFRFADLSAATPSFQIRITFQDSEVRPVYDGALIYGRSDGDHATSPSYVLSSDGTAGVLTIERTDGNSGQLTIDLVELAPFGPAALSYDTQLLPLATADVLATYTAVRGRCVLDNADAAIVGAIYSSAAGETITATLEAGGAAIPADISFALVVDGLTVASATSDGSQTAIELTYMMIAAAGTITGVATRAAASLTAISAMLEAGGAMRFTNGSIRARTYGPTASAPGYAIALDAMGGSLGGQITRVGARKVSDLSYVTSPDFSWNLLGDFISNPLANVFGGVAFTLTTNANGAVVDSVLLDFESTTTPTVGYPSTFAGVPNRYDCVWFLVDFTSAGDVRLRLDDLTVGALYVVAWDIKRIELQRETPDVVGYEGWKKAWLQRALDSVIQSWWTAVAGEDIPDFLIDGEWTSASSENWMTFIEAIQPRLRQAFRVGRPTDVGQPALTPAGLRQNNGIATLGDPTNAVPVLQALQPWMVRHGIYVSHQAFWPRYHVADVAGPTADFSAMVPSEYTPPTPPPPPEGCTYALPTMAANDEVLWINCTTLSGLARQNGGSPTAGNYNLTSCMDDAGSIVALGTGNETNSSFTPKYLTRNGSSFDVAEFTLPTDAVIPPFNDMDMKVIARNGAILGTYDGNVSPGVHGTVGVYWPAYNTTPIQLTQFSVPSENADAVSDLSADGNWIFGTRDSDGFALYYKVDEDATVELDTTGNYFYTFGVDYCAERLFFDDDRLFQRTPDTDAWAEMGALDITGYTSYGLGAIAAEGLKAVGSVVSGGTSIGAIFDLETLTVEQVIDEVDGSPQLSIIAYRCSHDATVVTGAYVTGSFQTRGWIWDAVNGCRSFDAFLDGMGVSRGNWVTNHVLCVSATGRHFLIRMINTVTGFSNVFYVTAPDAEF